MKCRRRCKVCRVQKTSCGVCKQSMCYCNLMQHVMCSKGGDNPTSPCGVSKASAANAESNPIEPNATP